MAEISTIIIIPKCAQKFSGWNILFSNSWNNFHFSAETNKVLTWKCLSRPRQQYSFGNSFFVDERWQANFHQSIYCWNFDDMQKTFEDFPGSNSTKESISGVYITMQHIITLSYPPMLCLFVSEIVEIYEIRVHEAYRSVAGRKFYDSKIIFSKNIDPGVTNAHFCVILHHLLASIQVSEF